MADNCAFQYDAFQSNAFQVCNPRLVATYRPGLRPSYVRQILSPRRDTEDEDIHPVVLAMLLLKDD